MKTRRRTMLIRVALAWLALAALAAIRLPAAPPGEFRGVWIHRPTGVLDWGWDKSIRVLSEQGFNAIFVNLVWAGCSDYPSQVLTPHPSLVRSDGSCRDLMQECLDACRKYGVQLHVWIVTCNASEHTPASVREGFRAAGRLQESCDPKDTKSYLAPQHPENLRLLRETVAEILRNYPVDGIHLDYIRYPNGNYDFSPRARRDFERSCRLKVQDWPRQCQKGGELRERFNLWRRDNITGIVRQVRQAIDNSPRPQAALSVAVYGLWQNARDTVAQDAAAWVDAGLVDFVCPMNYSADAEEAAGWLRLQVKSVAGRVPIYAGLGSYLCQDSAAVATQIDDARRYGADGFILFQYRPPLSDKYLPELHQNAVPGRSAAPYAHQLRDIHFSWRHLLEESGEAGWLRWQGEVLEASVAIPDRLLPSGDPQLQCTVLLDGQPWGTPELAERTSRKECRFVFRADEPGVYRLRLEWQGPAGQRIGWLSPCARLHLLPGDIFWLYLKRLL